MYMFSLKRMIYLMILFSIICFFFIGSVLENFRRNGVLRFEEFGDWFNFG